MDLNLELLRIEILVAITASALACFTAKALGLQPWCLKLRPLLMAKLNDFELKSC